MIQIVFGWPGIVAFVAIASMAAWMPSYKLMWAALVLSLPSAFYLFGGNGWIRVMALYIPVSLLISMVLLKNKRAILPKLMMAPIYVFYIYLGYAVYTQ